MGCAGEGLIPAHMKVISPTDEVKHWGILGLASYGRSGNGECVDEQMDGQKNDVHRHACMGTYMHRLEKECGAGKESGRDTELRDSWLYLVFHYTLGTNIYIYISTKDEGRHRLSLFSGETEVKKCNDGPFYRNQEY